MELSSTMPTATLLLLLLLLSMQAATLQDPDRVMGSTASLRTGRGHTIALHMLSLSESIKPSPASKQPRSESASGGAAHPVPA
jgi:hypothetical protein